MEIYSVVSGHNYYSNIALVKAFDFNMLLSEYDPQEHTSFDKVVVKVDGTDVAVKKRLFDTSVDSPKVEAVEGSAGVYQIKYGGDALSWTKVDGIIEIDTKEKTLDELAAGEFWSIAIKGNNEDNFMIPRSNGSWVMISPNQQMSITKTSEGKKWNASVMGYSFKFYVTEDNKSESADWSGN